ncbi:MAG: HNH endonuclease [Gemmataceae bacterium]
MLRIRPEESGDLPFQIDHIVAEQHGGRTVAANLALSCLPDNKHKEPSLARIDLVTGGLVLLLHPRFAFWR